MKRPYFITILLVIFLLFNKQNSWAQVYGKGLDFDDESYASAPKKATLTRSLDTLPSSASIKNFAPYPKTQGDYGTCTAWATAYCGRTMVDAIKNNWTDRDSITAHAFSPSFLFRLLRPNDNTCMRGSNVEFAFQLLKDKGTIHFTDAPMDCIPTVDSEGLDKASKLRLKDFARLFDVTSSAKIKIQAVKKSISEKKPVVFGMICPPSFVSAVNCWQPTEEPLNSYGGHAMCVVGYDDKKYDGAFEIQNSWGSTWGNGGYIWIKYADFGRFTKYAYEFIDLPDPKPEVADLSGSIKLVLSTGDEMQTTMFTSTRGLTVVPAKKTPEPLTIFQTASAYTSGTNFRIYISNNEPAYVYAISSDLSNEVTPIFPYKDGISAALTYKKNDVAIPDEDHFIQFDNKPGKDFLCVLYSRSELNINDILAKIKAQQEGSFNQKVFKTVGDRMVEPENVHFNNDKIAFQAFSKGKEILAFMVELDHK